MASMDGTTNPNEKSSSDQEVLKVALNQARKMTNILHSQSVNAAELLRVAIETPPQGDFY